MIVKIIDGKAIAKTVRSEWNGCVQPLEE